MWASQVLPFVAFLMIVLASEAYAGLIPHMLYGKRVAGQVVDGETGKPIPGAHVAFLWESTIIPSGFTGHNARDICYHAAATITDSSGKFNVASWKKWSTYDVHLVDPYFIVYAPSYEPIHGLTKKGRNDAPTEHSDEHYRLLKLTGPANERIDKLFWNVANRSCEYGTQSQKSLYPMLKALYLEARAIARTKDQQQRVRQIAEFAADAALAREPNKPIDEKATNEFIEEQLK